MTGSLFSYIVRKLPSYQASVAFDVGANVGQTVAQLISSFPQADVHAFEPVSSSFKVLEDTFGGQTKVHLYNKGLGSSCAVATMLATERSTNNRIIPSTDRSLERSNLAREDVQIERGDDFCNTAGIDHISVLKVDTEGHDLAVLVGFSSMLSRQAVDFIQVEASMNIDNLRHVDFRKFIGYLEPLGYDLFYLFDLCHESRNRPVLRRANLAFISKNIAKNHLISRGG